MAKGVMRTQASLQRGRLGSELLRLEVSVMGKGERATEASRPGRGADVT